MVSLTLPGEGTILGALCCTMRITGVGVPSKTWVCKVPNLHPGEHGFR